MRKNINKILKNFGYQLTKTKKESPYSFAKLKGKNFKLKKNSFWDYEFNNWEPQTFEIYKKYLKPDKSYIDIGTWIGPTMIIASSLGVSKIWGVEANPVTFGIVNENICLNESLTRQVSLSNICITNKEEGLQSFGFDFDTEASTSSIGRSHWSIKTTTLSKYIEDNKIDDFNFIKIDIEGAESLITNDFKKLSERRDLIIFLSLHPPLFSDKENTTKSLLEAFEVFAVFDSSDKELPLNRLKEMMLTEESFPEWGTEFGNFFEVLLKTKQ